jgi:hypothetical protein
MAPFTEIVAAVVVHSSAMALSHFGVVIEPPKIDTPQPVAERVVARSPRKTADCRRSHTVQPATATRA